MSVLVSLVTSPPLLPAVKQLWGDGDHMAEIDDMMSEQKAIRGEKAKSVWDLLRDRAVRWQLITLFLVVSCMQLIGANVVRVVLCFALCIADKLLSKSNFCKEL